VKAEEKKQIVKSIKIDVDKCTGCQVCEVICSSSHAQPKYSSNNPERSRIRVVRDPITDRFVPVYGTVCTQAECSSKVKDTIAGKEYDECTFCGASCPARDLFKEPDSGLPLNCDRCEGEDEPLCVKWCYNNALTCETREEAVEK
jgi:benzoyl-CoA reductase subunit BamC